MPDISRRTFLSGALAAGLTVGTTSRLAGAAVGRRAPGRTALTRLECRAVIIGSGFGGGVAALRLAEAGVEVLVLERGIRWPTGPNAETFPHATHPDKRTSWLCSSLVGPLATPEPVCEPYTGLIERVRGHGMDIMCGAGVGGGSLVYQGMSLQPTEEVFHAAFPEQLDYRRMDAVHYPRVARMLGLATAPDELIQSEHYRAARLFATHVRSAGYPLAKVPMPIDWSFALRELRGEMKPSYTNGDCALGVNNGGKHSVDVTYIAAAERTGRVTVAPLHNVTDIARAPDGRWLVSVDRIDTSGAVLEQKLITTGALILAAGSPNTSRLLVRAAAKGQIPDLPDGIGANWGSNGDRIYAWTNLGEDFGAPQGGPVIYCSREWSDPVRANTVIQASIPPLPVNARSTMLVGYGVSEGRGTFVYDSANDDAVLNWPADADSAARSRIHERVAGIAGGTGLLTDTTTLDTTTWHP
ncbi:MAG TPA: GMC family oxidoreductase N-terminal domain-containing protein, partial [Acidimicrobiia bacterium]|nr:GMC family oxidoreductase N-terminal domain-containing protein [Acidimicrobiia bacterium]